MNNNNNYETYIVAYLDILGFKKHIDASLNCQATYDKIWDILHFFRNTEYEQRAEDSVKHYAISDNIFLLCKLDENAVDRVLKEASSISFQCIKYGFVTRGGIFMGDAYEDGNSIFGPAINQAVMLENEVAYYPRVIIDDRIRAMKSSNLNYAKQDNDGLYFIDFLNDPQCELEDLELIRQTIANRITSNIEAKYLSKNLWLATYFNQTIIGRSDVHPLSIANDNVT